MPQTKPSLLVSIHKLDKKAIALRKQIRSFRERVRKLKQPAEKKKRA